MAEATSSIFNKKATDKLRNPDDLERYIRVTNPSIWVVLLACVFLVAGLLVWGVLGSVTTSVGATGVVRDGQAVCFLPADDVAKVHTGDVVNFGGSRLTVSEVATVPLSHDEARQELGSDYLTAALISGDWAYRVDFDGDVSKLAQDVPLTASITVERIAPISLIMRNWD